MKSCRPKHRGGAGYFGCVLLCIPLLAAVCRSENSKGQPAKTESVVVYCSVDPEFAGPILADFEKRTGIRVFRQFDTEAGKTTGLVNKLLAERAAPRADVFWSSEIFGTFQLAREGILAPYSPKTASDIPQEFRSDDGLWTAFGLRGRVIAYDPKRTKRADLPTRWADLVDPKYKGRIAMADPRFGTTRGHMATLLSLWGEDAMKHFYEGLQTNEFRRADGNSHSVFLLSRGVVDLAATDTDDVVVAQARGDSIEMTFPDLDSPDGSKNVPGTLWIPCSVGLVKDAPHPAAAKQVIDYLASAEIEKRLAQSDSRNRPVRESLRAESEGVPSAPGDQAKVDYEGAAAVLEKSDRLVNDVLLR